MFVVCVCVFCGVRVCCVCGLDILELFHVIGLPCICLPAQGHLSRCLAFQHGLNVTSIEAVGCHQERAARYDQQVAFGMRKEVCKAAKAKQDSSLVGDKVDPVELKCGRLQHITSVVGCYMLHLW